MLSEFCFKIERLFAHFYLIIMIHRSRHVAASILYQETSLKIVKIGIFNQVKRKVRTLNNFRITPFVINLMGHSCFSCNIQYGALGIHTSAEVH